MAIEASDLIMLRSTNNDLGGVISANVIPNNTVHNLFDSVSGTEANLGDTEYRCFYIKNNHVGLTLSDAVVKLSEQIAVSKVTMSIGLGTAAIGGIEPSIPDESTAPIGVFFSSTLNQELAVGDLIAGKHIAVWLKRVCIAGTPSFASEGSSVTITGNSPL